VGPWHQGWAWDGFVKDGLWGGFLGLGTLEDNLLGINGSDAQHQTWDGLKHTVVGAYAYGMDLVGEDDPLSDWQRDRVLLDFWDYYLLVHPEDVVSYWNEYVKEHGRNPLAGLRDITV
jgi:hypothetical protein